MDDTNAVVVGRVRWFDAALQQGVIIDVGGKRYAFDGEAEADLEALAVGQLVTFRDAGYGALGRVAGGVRPIRAVAQGYTEPLESGPGVAAQM